MTSYLLLFALSDGTSLDFGPSTRGFIRDVTGIGLMEPPEQEMPMWQNIFSSVHRVELELSGSAFYNLVSHYRMWNAVDDVEVNVFDFPPGAPAPALPSPAHGQPARSTLHTRQCLLSSSSIMSWQSGPDLALTSRISFWLGSAAPRLNPISGFGGICCKWLQTCTALIRHCYRRYALGNATTCF